MKKKPLTLFYCRTCPAWTGTNDTCPTCKSPCVQKEVPKRRADYYFLPESEEPLVSVTKVLGVIHKPGLEYWKIKTATTAALKDPSLSVEEAIATIYGIRDKAGSQGSDAHSIINSLQKEGDKGIEYQGEVGQYVTAYRKWKQDMPHKMLHSEQTVYSLKHKYAGTLDSVVELDSGKRVLVDFKTSNFLAVEFDWQIAAYRHALKEMGIDTDNGAILQLHNDGTYTWKESNAPIEPFLACLTLYHASKE